MRRSGPKKHSISPRRGTKKKAISLLQPKIQVIMPVSLASFRRLIECFVFLLSQSMDPRQQLRGGKPSALQDSVPSKKIFFLTLT